MENPKRIGLAKESYLLLIICLADLLSTMWFVSTEQAIEGNPLMAFYLKHGWGTLALAKMLLAILPLFIAEWCRRYSPDFVHRMLRVAIVVYLGMYAIALANALVLDHRIPYHYGVSMEQQLPGYDGGVTSDPRLAAEAR